MLRRLCLLAAITLLAAPATPETARPAAGVLAAIDDLLGDAYPMKLPGAAAIVAVDGKAVFKRAYGLADAEFGILLEPDMVFRIGSVTKAFTAALVLKLVEQGDLSLTEPVTTYLPDSPPGWRAITLEHTLAHTSGLPNYTARPEYRARMAEALTVEELLARFASLPLEFTPGTRWSYSNSGYAVAGAVVEQVTGRPFAEVLRDRLLAPVGLHRTMYDDPRQVVPRRARGYVVAGEEVLHAPYLHMSQAYAAGALASTLDDLAAWDTALTN
ncbi:MAG TPA: serine hydrolase domain-containing protein, partial [Methylomirabilota bacterium]